MGLSSYNTFGVVLLAISLILVPIGARGDNDTDTDDVPPSLAPFFDDLCKEVECGKGRCETAIGSAFNFKCSCDDGWKRTRLDDDQDLEFLPCIIPDCEVDYSCMPMPAPPPLPATPHNTSFFDPCYWVYCGEGRCANKARERTHTHTHTCECNSGYSNLLNVSAFPCYSDCAIGSNSCERLGLKSATSTSNSNPSPNADSSNSNSNSNSDRAALITLVKGKSNWKAVLLLFTTAALAFSR